MTWTVWLIPICTSVIGGMILYALKTLFQKQQEKEDIRDKAKAKETALVLETLNAVGKLTVANTIALRDGKTNGDTTAALTEYEHVEKKLYHYLVQCHSEFVK